MEIFLDEFAMAPKRFIAGTKGSYGFCTLDFKFSGEWNGLTKKATFYPRDGSGAVCLLIGDGPLKIPKEVMVCEGVNRYVVSGSRGEDILISVTGEIDVLNSLSPDGVPAEEPTPSQMQQVFDMMQTAIDTAQGVKDDAENGVFNGEQGDRGEKGLRGESGLVPRVTASVSAGDFELSANTEYSFPPLTGTLNLTFGAPEVSFSNEWIFVLTQGLIAQTVTLPEIEWYLGIAPTFGVESVTEVRVHKVGDVYKGVWLA